MWNRRGGWSRPESARETSVDGLEARVLASLEPVEPPIDGVEAISEVLHAPLQERATGSSSADCPGK